MSQSTNPIPSNLQLPFLSIFAHMYWRISIDKGRLLHWQFFDIQKY
jgi:hypothetical protein